MPHRQPFVPHSLAFWSPLATAAAAAARVLRVKDVWIWLYDESADVLRLESVAQSHPALNEVIVPVAGSVLGQVVSARTARVVADPMGLDSLWDWRHASAGRPGWGLFVPLCEGDRAVGLLMALSDVEPIGREEDVRLAQALSCQAIVAIQNARLYEDAQRQARRLAMILDVNKQLALGPALEEILSRITEGATHLLGAGGASLWLVECGSVVVAATYGLPEPGVIGQDQPRGENLSWRVATENRPVIFTDLESEPRADRQQSSDAARLHSWLGVPLRGRDSVLGTLAVLSRDARRFTKSDVGLLEAFADQAAVAIENARLFQQAATAEALRELDRLKTEFLSTASHELRTPLSLIYGYSELLMHRAPSLTTDSVAEMATEIHSGARMMVRLVDDLLDFSRLEQGRLHLARTMVSVSGSLRWLIQTLRRQPGGDRISAEFGEGLEAYVDPERLNQVVGNLLTNALRYAQDGPITVRAEKCDGWLHISVSDRGPGIAPEEQERVWEKFYRGLTTANMDLRGNGLGLAVVKYLVELHGGRVDLVSTLGQGTTFSVLVPAEKQL